MVFFGHRNNLIPTVLGLLDAWDGMYRFFCVLSWEIAVVAAPILFGVALLTEAKWGTRARHNWKVLTTRSHMMGSLLGRLEIGQAPRYPQWKFCTTPLATPGHIRLLRL